jgi:hypothetical protein
MSDTVATKRVPVLTLIAVDLGKKRDWTALSIAQKFMDEMPIPDEPETTRTQSVYEIPYLDRVRNQSYELIADRIAGLKMRPELKTAMVVIDETGVGTAVGDMLEARSLQPWRVTITGGIEVTQQGLAYHVPKRDLATIVAILLKSRRLRIAKELPLAEALKAELENFEAKISLTTGHDSYGAGDDWREGNHDDLVLAVALAVWLGERSSPSIVVSPTVGYKRNVFGDLGRFDRTVITLS